MFRGNIYIDMDGVLADFSSGINKIHGLSTDKTKEEIISKIQGTDFFSTLPKFSTADQLISTVKHFTGGRFSILSAPLRGDNENSEKHKRIWINDNIEKPNEIIITGRKESFAKDRKTGMPNILIDDRRENTSRWINAGGRGILYQANKDTVKEVRVAIFKILQLYKK
tara:strand:- start:748 stop:1251 length:504 start_codon:yes stop_codon:yes gene_type:complete